LTVNGAVTLVADQVAAGDPHPLRQKNQLFRNLGPSTGTTVASVRYAEVTAAAGAAFAPADVGRGAAFGDLDGDGDTDVLLLANGGPARLLLNVGAAGNRFLSFELETGEPPRAALGARVAVAIGEGRILLRRVRADGSYGAANDPRIQVGIGTATASDGFVVTWPDGSRDSYPAIAASTHLTVRQRPVSVR
jgi:hypothetical protein